MKQSSALALALAMGLVASASAQAQNQPAAGAAGATTTASAAPRLAQNTPVVIVGEVTSQPRGILNESKMQVAIGPAKTDYTLHLSDAKMHDALGAVIRPDNFAEKMWVRAEGTVMDDPRRIKVMKLQVIGQDMPSLKQSAFYRPGFDQGYVMAVAGTRQIFPETTGVANTPAPMVIVGLVSSDTGPLESTRNIQVDAAGNTWTLTVPKETPLFDTQGKKISVHQIGKGQWVRAHGWQTDDLRVRTARLQELGPQEAFSKSTYFRAGAPMGYVERTPGAEVRFNPIQVTGTITAINESAGTITLRDQTGKERVFPLSTLTIRADGRPADTKMLRQGQQVTVEGSEILF